MKKLKILKIGLISLVFLIGCQQPEPQKVFTGEKQFRTTDPSRLYFKNMRSVYYYLENRANSKVDIYCLKKYDRTRKRPIIYPKIVNDWLKDEAYIFIEDGSYPDFPNDTLKLFWSSERIDSSGLHTLGVRTKKAQYEFAGAVYESLTQGADFKFINAKNDTIPIFEEYSDKVNFMMTVRDYYRLTEVY